MFKIKRIYELPDPSDGHRILIDRLWPRGISKDSAKIDEWIKEVAPSAELRKWFHHDPAKWSEFKIRYAKELRGKEDLLEKLRTDAGKETVTLLYSAKDEEHNQAVALKEFLEKRR
jgi:uncharacterized protein YeaO (DUF488 family)